MLKSDIDGKRFGRTLEGWVLYLFRTHPWRLGVVFVFCAPQDFVPQGKIFFVVVCLKVLSLEPCCPEVFVLGALLTQGFMSPGVRYDRCRLILRRGRYTILPARRRIAGPWSSLPRGFVFPGVSPPKGIWGGVNDAARASGCRTAMKKQRWAICQSPSTIRYY